ncbi:MAG: type II toxin-antitoxin system VapC family toxin [Solirubrobacterales bacterium]
MIVLDTTVLVYAKGAGHRFRDPCRTLITAIADGRVEATTSVEVIQEFVHVRRRNRRDAASLGRDYTELLEPLLPITPEALERGLALFERSTRLGAFDAVLCAAAADVGATALVSADAAFSEAHAPPHVVPDMMSLAGLLGD